MEKTLQDLGGIVLYGLPTFFIVLLLVFCVKYLYLKPLDKVLAERFRLTEGARLAAEQSLQSADEKIAEYKNKLAVARSELYASQADFLKKLHDEQTARVQTAKATSEATLAAARASIAAEAESARMSLAAQSELLSGEIADAVLQRRVA